MSITFRLNKPWRPLKPDEIIRLPGQLGVYQVANEKGMIVFIGQADARSKFGLRGELQRELNQRGQGHQFRIEVNMQYRTRWIELLMIHEADFGSLPVDNIQNSPPLGRISPA